LSLRDETPTIRLYSADAIGNVFAAWHISANQTIMLQLNGQNINIGGDWIIDVVFGNGVTSKRHLVWKVGTFQGGKWICPATSI
jgi:hypothetical protein